MKFVYAFYPNEEGARRAVQALVDAHIAPPTISVLIRNGPEVEKVPVSHRTRAGHDAAIGGVVGATLGIAVASTGIAGVLAAGPLLGALEGATLGGFGGTLAGAIRGLGWWKSDMEFPHERVDAGGVLVGASVTDVRVPTVRNALESTDGLAVGVTEQSPMHQARACLTSHTG